MERNRKQLQVGSSYKQQAVNATMARSLASSRWRDRVVVFGFWQDCVYHCGCCLSLLKWTVPSAANQTVITFGGSCGIHCQPVGGRAHKWMQLQQEYTSESMPECAVQELMHESEQQPASESGSMGERQLHSAARKREPQQKGPRDKIERRHCPIAANKFCCRRRREECEGLTVRS